ncbi:uncharacterized protein LOC110700535 [Chenopodium quinoa]|uniref:uncharacterized protein LOC110700535 n=1 Tax=Chenopodium quinoa TaxID=63459 RepID=UPI000B770C42|nr:uncharacterized protein LOC110700535 [Chenopodium quinoa]
MIKYVDLFKYVSAMQAPLSDYAFSEGPNDEVLYHDGENSVNREEMKTLGTDEEVDNAVIDALAHILNTKGKKHSIYFSTMTYLIVCTDMGKSVNTTKEVRHEKFAERLNYEMTNSGITNIKKYREFFFPVPAFKHFYLLCINIYNGTIDLIDNRKLPMNVKESTKYEDNPQKMLEALAYFMRTKDYTGSDIARVLSFKTNLIKMKWRSNLDHKNCGVYVMKHMETYTTEPLVEWNCDLKANNVDQIRKLRVQYCSEIILSRTKKEGYRVKMAARRRMEEN